MSVSSTIRRRILVGTAAGAALVLGASPAMAHHCYVPMYSLNGPSSPNWIVFSAEDGASSEAGYDAPCDGAVDAGYAALQDAGLPVGIKIFGKMTIGHPKGEGGSQNPNGADGVGLEYFGDGSTLADEMLVTFIEGAESYMC